MAENVEKSEIAKKEEEILKFWQENKIFEKSLDKKGEDFVFYDGPPFATGLPHYGHLLASTLKDTIPRYQTMRGKRVRRKWGWDCHGLPIENLIEKELGLKSKKDIEQFGVELFNQKARDSVLRYADEWKRIIPRLGRWVDMENDYRSMNSSYTESVWWVFKTLFDKGLAYEGYKSMHLCPRCETTLANFEVNLGYKDITDISVYVKFELVDEPGTYLLAWTTTPWTLPGNVALAVNAEINYLRIKTEDGSFIVAKDKIEEVLKDKKFEVVEEFKGEKLVGKKYQPFFDFYANDGELKNKENGWQIYAADFVTAEEGTGVVHIAPAFGEDDMKLGEEKKLPFVQHVSRDGHFKPEVKGFDGMAVKPKSDDEKERLQADIAIIKYLQEKGNYFDKKKITHSYPHCWRCDTPLLNYASSSWFIKVTDMKEKLLAENQKVKWVPEHIQSGRFGKWLEGARDWAVSRQRFWGAPLPIWKDSEGKVKVFGSLEDLKKSAKKSGNRYLVIRHGQGTNNATGIVSGKSNSGAELTEKGIKQTHEAGQKLKTEKIDLIISSPFTRATQTAEMVAEEIGLGKDKIIYDERIEEIHTGEFDGKTNAEFHAFHSEYQDIIWKRPNGGENLRDLRKRAMEFMYELETKYQGKTILLSTHEYTAWMLWAGTLAWTDEEIIANKPDEFLQNAEMRELPFIPLPHNTNYELDFHRPFIDQYELVDEKGEKLTRIEDVFDVWFESGSMPYGQVGYPAHNKDLIFPADFIAEGLDQTRGWFYSLLVLGVGLFEKSPYKNVIVNGMILAEDGQKMSKRLNNYPGVEFVFDKYGVDALRFYLLSSPVVKGEDLNFSERGLGEVMRRVIMRLKNVLAFYKLYDAEQFNSDADSKPVLLDTWINSRLSELNQKLTNALDTYELDQVGKPIDQFVDDFSTWFLRRSRDRFKSENVHERQGAIETTRATLLKLSQLIAPIMPYVAEEIYQAIRYPNDVLSVHLTTWPEAGSVNNELLGQMEEVRNIVTMALEARTKAGVKVRQPLNKLKIKNNKLQNQSELLDLIKDEVNVKEVEFVEKLEGEVELDTEITPELKLEGEARDLMRALQDWRKESNLDPKEKIKLQITANLATQDLVKKFEAEIKRVVLVTEIEFKDGEGDATFSRL